MGTCNIFTVFTKVLYQMPRKLDVDHMLGPSPQCNTQGVMSQVSESH